MINEKEGINMETKKDQMLKAIESLEDEYDAFYLGNRYGVDNTHKEEFELLKQLKGDKVPNALAFIHDCYDCYYKSENGEDSPFNYLRKCVENEFN